MKKTSTSIVAVIVLGIGSVHAEQSLSVPEIMNVLMSLSDENTWQYEGSCQKSKIDFKYGDGKKYVNAMTAFNLGTMEPWYDIEIIQEPTINYYFFTHKFKRGECELSYNGYMDDCSLIHKNQIEVVSKKLVRVKQTMLRKVPIGKPESGIVDSESICTFMKKEGVD